MRGIRLQQRTKAATTPERVAANCFPLPSRLLTLAWIPTFVGMTSVCAESDCHKSSVTPAKAGAYASFSVSGA
jgi:hypothetical protein